MKKLNRLVRSSQQFGWTSPYGIFSKVIDNKYHFHMDLYSVVAIPHKRSTNFFLSFLFSRLLAMFSICIDWIRFYTILLGWLHDFAFDLRFCVAEYNFVMKFYWNRCTCSAEILIKKWKNKIKRNKRMYSEMSIMQSDAVIANSPKNPK